jgi:hypothetical protein
LLFLSLDQQTVGLFRCHDEFKIHTDRAKRLYVNVLQRRCRVVCCIHTPKNLSRTRIFFC